jgi:hypothetical protein
LQRTRASLTVTRHRRRGLNLCNLPC